LGVGRRALDALLDLAPSKQRGYGPVSTLAARPALQRVVGESELRLRAIRALAITFMSKPGPSSVLARRSRPGCW